MNIKENILRIFSANFLEVISRIIISFIIPIILSITEYSNLKTYMLYISYITVFTLGFEEGMYIKYGGKEFNEINLETFKYEHRLYILLQIVFSTIVFLLGAFSENLILILMAITIVPYNIVVFFKANYKALGEFKIYTKIVYLQTILDLILNILLVFFIKSSSYIMFCLAIIVINLAGAFYVEGNFYKKLKGIKCVYNKKIKNNFKVGFVILIANLSIMIFYGLDRWFIKIFFTEYDFAYYSFAISMLNLINILINSISVIFYNYIAKDENKTIINNLKRYLLILGAFASLSYFGFAAVINIFIKKYIPSLNIIAISFSAYPYIIVINIVIVNLYKARKEERKYLKVVLKMLGIAFLYNLITTILFKNSILIAASTTASFITWYFYSLKDFSYLFKDKKELKFLTINLIGFLISSHLFNWFLGGIIYLAIILLTVKIFFKNEFLKGMDYMRNNRYLK